MDARIKFRHVSCFLSVANHGSLVGAAQDLCITQPAVSKTLKELEDILSTRLFERLPKGVILTAAGRLFMQHAGPSFKAMEDAIAAVANVQEAQASVHIGVLSTVEAAVIPDVIAAVHRRNPQLTISTSTGPSDYLLSQLRMGEAELVVGRLTEANEIRGLAFEQLYAESMQLLVRPEHPLATETGWALKALEKYPLVLPTKKTIIRHYADQLFAQHNIQQSHQRLETLSPAMSFGYLNQTDALWIAPASVARPYLQRGQAVALSVPDSQTHGAVGVCFNESYPLSEGAVLFCDVLREYCKQL